MFRIFIYSLLVCLFALQIPQHSEAAIITEPPRLFFGAEDVALLRARAATSHNDIWTAVEGYVAFQMAQPIPSSAPPNGGLDDYRNYGNMLIPLAFACVVSDDAPTCDYATDALVTIAGWQQWGEYGQVGLGQAHLVLGSAVAYDWLYASLSEDERRFVREALGFWTNRLYEASAGNYRDDWNNWWRKSYMQNHYAVIHSSLGIGALTLLGEDDRADLWLRHAVEKMAALQHLLDGIADGTWHESMTYQSYMLALMLPFLTSLERLEAVDLIPDVYLQNYPAWRLYNHLPDTTQFIMTHGDFEWSWGNSLMPQHLLRLAAQRYEDGHAEWLAQALIAADGRAETLEAAPWYVFEFLYYDPTIAPQSPAALPHQRVFPDMAGVIWRTGWDSEAVVLGFRTGAYGGRFAFDSFMAGAYPWEQPCADTQCSLNVGHDHRDANSFTVYKGGDWLVREVSGVERNETGNHNTVLINGEGQYAPPANRYYEYAEDFADSAGRLDIAEFTRSYGYLVGQADGRYRNIVDIQQVERHLLLLPPGHLVLVDHLRSDAVHSYETRLHLPDSAWAEDNWIIGEGRNGNRIGVATLAPADAFTEIRYDDLPYVSTSINTSDTVIVQFLYMPDTWDAAPAAELVEQKEDGLHITFRDADRVDTILIGYGELRSRELGGYRFDGRVAVIQRDVAGRLINLFAYGGTTLTDSATGVDLLSNLQPQVPMEVNFSQADAYVTSSLGAPVTLLAPDISRLFIYGVEQSFERSGDLITFGG